MTRDQRTETCGSSSPSSLPVLGGRVDLDLTLARHEVTLVDITPVVDETPPWWDDRRLLGVSPEGSDDE